MICVVESRELLEKIEMIKDAFCVYIVNDGSLDHAIEPIMYKFLQRSAISLTEEL